MRNVMLALFNGRLNTPSILLPLYTRVTSITTSKIEKERNTNRDTQ